MESKDHTIIPPSTEKHSLTDDIKQALEQGKDVWCQGRDLKWKRANRGSFISIGDILSLKWSLTEPKKKIVTHSKNYWVSDESKRNIKKEAIIENRECIICHDHATELIPHKITITLEEEDDAE
jgi:hypothetical protein